MRVSILGAVPPGLAAALGPILAELGMELGPDADATAEAEEQAGEQATDAASGPSFIDPVVSLPLSQLTELRDERDAAIAHIEHMVETAVCKHCAAASAQELRIYAWAGAKLHASAPGLKWNDLNEVVRQELFNKAQAELAEFDEAQG